MAYVNYILDICHLPSYTESRKKADLIWGGGYHTKTKKMQKSMSAAPDPGIPPSGASALRTTVQMIYNSARKKLAAALVDGLPLRIEGGSYQLCDGKEEACGCGGCRRHLRACSQKTLMEEEVHEDRSPIG